MGGNALKQYNTVRLSSDEVNQLGNKVLGQIAQYLMDNNISGKAEIIPWYKNKQIHGDLDILINFEIPTETLATMIQTVSTVKGKTVPTVSNGSARSFGLQLTDDSIFQIDFIYANPKIYDFALSYFSYNDCGNLIGVTAHKTGLKFGHQGLQYVIRENNHVIGEIDVDMDFENALTFLGFDYERWLNGFDDLEDVFKFIANSKYFNADYYPLEHRSHIARVRDKKRPTYTAFLKWVQDNNPPSNPIVNKAEWLIKIFEQYPQAKIDYANAWAKLQEARAVCDKFNGDIVSKISGLHGKELGTLIAKIKNKFNSEQEFREFVLSHSENDISQLIIFNLT